MSPSLIKEQIDLYWKLMRLDKPIGILLLLWPTLWGLWLASGGWPDFKLAMLFILGTVLMRSAGCVINDVADRHFDPHVERTKNRPLAARKIRVAAAMWLFVVLVLSAFLLLLPILTPLIFGLAVIALLLAGSYPFTKRFFAVPQAYLGVSFGFGIPLAFAAVQGSVPSIAWMLLVANVFWAIAYDTEYAMVDREDDLKIGLRTSAITFGRFDVGAVMGCYGISLGILAVVGIQTGAGGAWFVGLMVAAGIALYHFTLIRDRDRLKCFAAFRHNAWFGLAIFAGIALN
ncbi:MAG: 4-hydroxybenzoate octaprenyltransferase [Rhodocyclaceae bacterium]|nr:4-hydroxybenzoate octaprenyltransferase [Rhodocyclaceae bacterium]